MQKFSSLLAALYLFSSQEAQAQSKKLEELMAKADKIAQEVSRGRGLKQIKPVEKKTIAQEEVRKKLVDEFSKEFKPGELESEAITFKKLGFLQREDDYRAILINVLTEQIAGFYDTDAKELFLVQEIAPDRGALAHEICHALQDQNFDLNKIQDEVEKKNGGDAALAFSALVEGDAMAVMLEDDLGWRGLFATIPDLPTKVKEQINSPDDRSKTLDNSPPIIKKSLVFPYLDGMAFVYALRQTGTWKVIDDAFADPPLSTEQILHPERYLKRDQPSGVPVFAVPNLEVTHKNIYESIFGEFQLGVWFQQALPEEEALKAAAGWDGDRFITFAPKELDTAKLTSEDSNSLVIAAISIWDTEADAKEAASAFSKVALSLLPSSRALPNGVIGYLDRPGAAHALVVQEKNKVSFVLGASAAFIETMRGDLQTASAALLLQ
jgi:hypothetical protein